MSGIEFRIHRETTVHAEIGLGYYGVPYRYVDQPRDDKINVIINAIEHDDGLLRLEVDNTNDPDWATLRSRLGDRLTESPPGKQEQKRKTGSKASHGNYAKTREGRAELVRKYREGVNKGTVASQKVFAQTNGISDRTLRSWLNDFPEEENEFVS